MMRAAPLAVIAVLLAATEARAYFESTTMGSRGISMARSSGAHTTDLSALYWNPAGLVSLRRYEVMLDYAQPFGLSDVAENAIALGGTWGGTGLALGWHRVGVQDVYGEDLFTVAASRRLPSLPPGHALAVGAAFKLARVAFQPYADPGGGGTVDYGAMTKGSVDAGLLWTTPWRVDVAWVGRDLLEPRFEFVTGSGGSSLERRHEIGGALRWNRESTVTLGWAQTESDRTSLNAGIEIWFFDVFALRSGLMNLSAVSNSTTTSYDFQYAGGFGLVHRGWRLDAAATTNHDLGVSYRASLFVPLTSDGPR